MPVTHVPFSPQDESVGIMHVRYLQGDRLANIQRIHLNTSTPSAVVTAFNGYADVVKAYYDGDWTIQLTGLDQVLGGEVYRVPCPVATDRTGSGSTPTSGIAGLTETIFTFKTPVSDPSDSRLFARLRFVGIGASVPAHQLQVSSTAGGTSADQALVAFAVNPAHHFVSHDGLPLLEPATKSTGLWKRERRRSMRKA